MKMSPSRKVRVLLIGSSVVAGLILVYYFAISKTTVVIGKDVPLEDTELGQFTELRGSRLPDDHERDGKLWLVKFQKTPGSDPEPEEITTEVPASEETTFSMLPPQILTSNDFDKTMVGFLNFDVWHWFVGYLVDDMRIKRDFPNNPDVRKVTSSLRVYFSEKDPEDVRGKYAHKIYGYLLPPTTGEYAFSIDMSQLTAACSAELWISKDSDPMRMVRVLVLEYPELGRGKAPISKRVESAGIAMQADVYYFEFLEKGFDGQCTVEIKWRTPGQQEFVSIPKTNFAMAVKLDGNGKYTNWPIVEKLKGHLPSNDLQTHHHVEFVGDTILPITDLIVLPSCTFQAEYVRARKVKQYTGIKKVFASKVYPHDNTWHKRQYKDDAGNKKLDPAVAEKVLRLYKETFSQSKRYDGEVLDIRYLEETPNEEKGSRFLLELDIQLKDEEKPVHTSEYVYLPTGKDALCHAENFQWSKGVDVYVVVSVKNLGLWVKHLIHNMEWLYSKTQDDNFELVIVDYESEDIDVEAVLRKSSLKRWKVIHEKGPFSRSGGLQAGVEYVTNPDSIVMTIDMHLTMPPGFVEYVRRHVVKGKMGFAPMFFRLRPGYTEININGFWETLTYGLFGMFKSDWTAFGGFDTQKYKFKWGGEDWDLLDKAIAYGYELFRIRYPGLMHYHHTKAGMWGNKDKKKQRR